jgi:hypothetical protein
MSDWSEGSYSPVYDPESNSWYDPNTVYQSRIDDFNREVYWNSINAGSDPAGPVDATKTVTFPDGSKMYLDANGQVVGSRDATVAGGDLGLTNQLTTSDRINMLAQSMGGLGSAAWKTLSDAFKKSDGTIDYGKLLGAAAGLGAGLGMFGGGDDKPKGYQGKIPELAVAREQVANTYDPNRRAGSGGLRYFTDTQYVPQGGTDAAANASALSAAKTAAGTQATGLASLNTANPARQATSPLKFAPLPAAGAAAPGTATTTTTPAAATAAAPASDVIKALPVPTYNTGGITTLAHGRYLDGPTDGMADKLPANIDGKQEARLSHGEFVIPADVVGHLGNGNSTAGAQRLYAMMDRIRQARTGTKKQGKQINPDKYTPA